MLEGKTFRLEEPHYNPFISRYGLPAGDYVIVEQKLAGNEQTVELCKVVLMGDGTGSNDDHPARLGMWVTAKLIKRITGLEG